MQCKYVTSLPSSHSSASLILPLTFTHTHGQKKINKPDVTATEAEQQLHCVAAEVDVTIHTAFVEFLSNSEILGCVDQCLCIFRLFPRPVVSLRPSTSMTTYQKNSPTTDTNFIRNLIRSQVLLASYAPSECIVNYVSRSVYSLCTWCKLHV